MSQLYVKNGSTWEAIPAGGVGVPSGGTANQILKKSSSTDYATEWSAYPHLTVTELLSERVISDQTEYTLSDSVNNYDIFILALAVSSGGTRAMNIVTRDIFQNSSNRNTLISYFGTSNYWGTTTVRGSGNKAITGTSQKGSNISTLYLSIYGIKLV